MDLSWIDFKNPVALWWIFLASASIVNIVFWSFTRIYLYKNISILNFKFNKIVPENLIWFSGAYVFGCAYRSIFIKADVQRICVFDSWFSSVFLGRSIATVAELCFVAQWAIVIRYLAQKTHLSKIEKLSFWFIPLIIIAECFSWFAVISTNYLGNSIEESLWTITYTLIAYALYQLSTKLSGALKYAAKVAVVFNILYILFMIFFDVSMYLSRWSQDQAAGKKYFSFVEGIIDLNTRWIVTHSISDWHSEIPWMSLYFSFAVLVSIGLCYIPKQSEN